MICKNNLLKKFKLDINKTFLFLQVVFFLNMKKYFSLYITVVGKRV